MNEHSISITWARAPSTDELEKLGYAARDAAMARGESPRSVALAMKEAIFRKAPIFCAGNLVVALNGEPVGFWREASKDVQTIRHSAAA